MLLQVESIEKLASSIINSLDGALDADSFWEAYTEGVDEAVECYNQLIEELKSYKYENSDS